MTTVWVLTAAMALISFVVKAAGPLVLGGRQLPREAARLIALLPAAVLTALVVTQALSADRELVVDARAAGLAAAIVAVALRASMVLVLLAAAVTTAVLRAALG
jgi:branched-subunit amino acid transport protein